MSVEVSASAVATLDRVANPDSLGTTPPDKTPDINGLTLSPGITASLAVEGDIASQQPYVNGRIPRFDNSIPPNGTGNANLQSPSLPHKARIKFPPAEPLPPLPTPEEIASADINDLAFKKKFKERDPLTFQILVQKTQNAIYFYCLEMLQNPHDAEDVVQQVFMNAYNAVNLFEEENRLTTWLFTTAKRRCLDELRRRARQPSQSLDEVYAINQSKEITPMFAGRLPTPEGVIAGKELRIAMQNELGKLSQILQRTIILRFYYDLPIEDIASLMRTNPNTVKTRLHRGLRCLKKHLNVRELQTA